MSPTHVVYRCSDDHLYSASFGKALLFSVHLGVGTHLQRCPVDHKFRKAKAVDPTSLTQAEQAEAAKHKF